MSSSLEKRDKSVEKCAETNFNPAINERRSKTTEKSCSCPFENRKWNFTMKTLHNKYYHNFHCF